jgi:hypothetical protein
MRDWRSSHAHLVQAAGNKSSASGLIRWCKGWFPRARAASLKQPPLRPRTRPCGRPRRRTARRRAGGSRAARGLRVVGVEPRRDAHTHVQQLNVHATGWLRWVWEQNSGRGRERPKDPNLGEGKEKMTWHCGTNELGGRIGKLLEQIVF